MPDARMSTCPAYWHKLQGNQQMVRIAYVKLSRGTKSLHTARFEMGQLAWLHLQFNCLRVIPMLCVVYLRDQVLPTSSSPGAFMHAVAATLAQSCLALCGLAVPDGTAYEIRSMALFAQLEQQ